MSPPKGLKVSYDVIFSKWTEDMRKKDLLDQHIHFHSHEIISNRWLRNRTKIRTKIFLRFAYGLFVGMSIIGVWLLQVWR
jgi:hypothetical protein